jgi:hypothetical protein
MGKIWVPLLTVWDFFKKSFKLKGTECAEGNQYKTTDGMTSVNILVKVRYTGNIFHESVLR